MTLDIWHAVNTESHIWPLWIEMWANKRSVLVKGIHQTILNYIILRHLASALCYPAELSILSKPFFLKWWISSRWRFSKNISSVNHNMRLKNDNKAPRLEASLKYLLFASISLGVIRLSTSIKTCERAVTEEYIWTCRQQETIILREILQLQIHNFHAWYLV